LVRKRTQVSTSPDPILWNALKEYSHKTEIPLARLLDRAIKEFLERNKIK
jgi:hypothetical protein